MTPRRIFAAALLATLCAGGGATFAEEQDDVLMRAMQDELARAAEELAMERMERPYFVAYRVDDLRLMRANAAFGALLENSLVRNRYLVVEMRVGTAALDNSNFLPARLGAGVSRRAVLLPQQDDYGELRRQIWLATDGAYKHALETLAKKRAALKDRTREELPDFAPEEPHVHLAELTAVQLDADAPAELARGLSAIFRERPGIDDSEVTASQGMRRTHYVNSEGTAFRYERPAAMVQVLAKTQAADGTVLQDFETFYEYEWSDLPDAETLEANVRGMADALLARREAASVPRYSGPVLFEGQAAAELFAQVLVPRLLAVRVPLGEDARMDGFTSALRNPFEDRIGARVLPRFLDVLDDPTLAAREFKGSYPVDDDGIAAAPLTLVENGVLKALLATRNPAAVAERSTGSNRGGVPVPSNLIVSAKRPMSRDELMEEFNLLVAERGVEFGVLVRRVGNAFNKLDRADGVRAARGEVAVERLLRAFKVYPDGREEPIRKAELSGVGEAVLRDIVAASDRATVYSLSVVPPTAYTLAIAAPIYGFSPIQPLSSISVPDLLFEEMTLREPGGNIPKPPVLAHPYFAQGPGRSE